MRLKKFFSDFKAFISKGNIVDLAVAVVIGSAFSKIVTSLVNDIIMPLIGAAVGRVNFSDLKWVIKQADEANGVKEVALTYGNFIQALVDFLIISFFIFLVLRILINSQNGMKKLNEQFSSEISKKYLTKDDKKLLKARGYNLKDKKGCLVAIQQIREEEAKKEAERKAQEELSKPKVETQEDILKDIRELLKEERKQNQSNGIKESEPKVTFVDDKK
jgi:large conductance mechanosensitive channel